MPSAPFGGPDAVLAYLSRYTHRVAIANSRLVAFDGERVTFKWKDYRAKRDARYKLMTLDADEFIRRFLIHVLPIMLKSPCQKRQCRGPDRCRTSAIICSEDHRITRASSPAVKSP